MTSDATTSGTIQDEPNENRRSFVSGNPFVDKKVGGVLHFYKKVAQEKQSPHNCTMLCMVGVPAFFTCRELIGFVAPMADAIFQMRIIRDDAPNQYMVILKFKSKDLAVSFFEQYNEVEFNSIERERCFLFFVERLEMNSEGSDDFEAVAFDTSASSSSATTSTTGDAPTTPPNCSVCLERMDDGLMTILCNHTFHAECLRKWADTSCPVCRDSQTPELVPTQACKDCNISTDLWMCLICGNIGCGRYTNGHAHKHFEATSHIFTLQVGGKMVWDYASDTYVHRLIQDAKDGKVIEYAGEDDARFEKSSEKLDAIQMEYSFYLTSQLENQRNFFEEKLQEAEVQRMRVENEARVKIASLEAGLEAKAIDCASLSAQLEKANAAKAQAEKKNMQLQLKYGKVQVELSAEKKMNEMLLKDKDLLSRQREELEKLRRKEIVGLEEQLQDLMMHFETQAKIQNALKTEDITNQELEDSQVEVKVNETPTSSKKAAKRSSRKS